VSDQLTWHCPYCAANGTVPLSGLVHFNSIGLQISSEHRAAKPECPGQMRDMIVASQPATSAVPVTMH
jgi:hypothetical protein